MLLADQKVMPDKMIGFDGNFVVFQLSDSVGKDTVKKSTYVKKIVKR